MEDTGRGVQFKHNRLPQWRLDGGIYHLVWRLQERGDELSPAERTIVADSIRLYHGERYQLAIFCVMDDHVHVLLQARRGHDMSGVLKGMKGPTAYAINDQRGRRGRLWQKSSHTELLRSQSGVEACRAYIYNNPLKHWGIMPHEYPWLEVFE